MATLVVDLQDGFFQDHVVVEVDGREIFRSSDVRTRTQLGMAGSTKVEVASGERSVRVSLPARNIAAEITVDVEERHYVGVSLEGGSLHFKLAARPFRYL